jgi:predicted nucleotidyltransferase
MRHFRDRDFIQTEEGFFFCVVGPFHPLDRVISYLKYVPSKSGLWGRKNKRFKRVLKAYTIPSLLETFTFIKKKHPHYMFHSNVYNVDMTAVPINYIKKHYKPEEKLAEMLTKPRLDTLQRKTCQLIRFLSETSGIDVQFFGVTGSILLNIHQQEFSDMDITIYGVKNSLLLKKTLTESYKSSNFAIKRFEGKILKKWCVHKTKNFPLSYEEARQMYERKWNLGIFKGTQFSIHSVKLENEIEETYGDKTFEPLGTVTIHGTVTENKESLFLPLTYHIKNVEIIETSTRLENLCIKEVVSYESIYDNLAEIGEKIEAKGKLELVKNKGKEPVYHRVLVGSPSGKGKEYIKLLH